MKRLNFFPLAVLLALAGCATQPKSDSAKLQGSWHGEELTPNHPGSATLVISGENLEFHGADSDDWLKAKFTVNESARPRQFIGVVTACASADYIGQKTRAIYKLEDGALTITGNGLDNPDFPASFDAAGSREFVFKR